MREWPLRCRDEQMPEALEDALAAFESGVHVAGEATRLERAPDLGVDDADPIERLKTFATRGADWSQPRPEWGLVNNAALILAPRARTQGKARQGVRRADDGTDAGGQLDQPAVLRVYRGAWAVRRWQ